MAKRIKVKREEIEFTARDVTMIFARALRIPVTEIAKYLSITDRRVRQWYAENYDRVNSLAEMLALWMQTNKTAIKREAVEDLMGELKQYDRESLQSLERALLGSDNRLAYEAGKELRDRRLGLPKSTVAHEGKVDHTMTHTIDQQVLRLMEADILKDADLMERRRELAIEGEVIDVKPSD